MTTTPTTSTSTTMMISDKGICRERRSRDTSSTYLVTFSGLRLAITVINGAPQPRYRIYFSLQSCFLNGPYSASFSFIFGLFKQIMQRINVKKCPSSIRRWDLNSWPSGYVSLPFTTRPGLPPNNINSMLDMGIICCLLKRLQQINVKKVPPVLRC